jgi:hypothetical protein
MDVKKKLKRFGLSGLNKPKRSPKGKKSHIVAVRDGILVSAELLLLVSQRLVSLHA